jgi:hypothetical protein
MRTDGGRRTDGGGTIASLGRGTTERISLLLHSFRSLTDLIFFGPLHDHRPSSIVHRPTALSASVHLSAFVAILSGLSGLGHFRDSIRRRRNT